MPYMLRASWVKPTSRGSLEPSTGPSLDVANTQQMSDSPQKPPGSPWATWKTVEDPWSIKSGTAIPGQRFVIREQPNVYL